MRGGKITLEGLADGDKGDLVMDVGGSKLRLDGGLSGGSRGGLRTKKRDPIHAMGYRLIVWYDLVPIKLLHGLVRSLTKLGCRSDIQNCLDHVFVNHCTGRYHFLLTSTTEI